MSCCQNPGLSNLNIESHHSSVIGCQRCRRLVEWREKVAREKTRRFSDQSYWGKPVPGFGVNDARLLIVGLAPAAHGANRTGRMFTGDRSGDWLYRALYKAGFANQPQSESLNDGLSLRDCYITALCRCAPPQNKPAPDEFANCNDYLITELQHFIDAWKQAQQNGVVVCLGQLSYRYTMKCMVDMGIEIPRPRPRFTHGVDITLRNHLTLICSFHPSQQNTFTGKLTEIMLDAVFHKANAVIGGKGQS